MSNEKRLQEIAAHASSAWWQRGEDWLVQNLSMPENMFLSAVRHAVMLALPLLLAAAGALLVKHFPLDVYQRFMVATFGLGWQAPCDLLYNATIEVLALAISLSLSAQLVENHNAKYPTESVNTVVTTLVALSSLVIMIGPEVMDKEIVLPWIGMRGLFGSLILTSFAVTIFLRLYRTPQLRFSFYTEDSDPLLPQVFSTLLPAFLTLLVFIVLRFTLMKLGIPSVHQAFYAALQAPFAGAQDSFSLGAFYTLLVQICWFFGIHGPDLLDPITHDIFHASMAANSEAFNASQAPVHIYTKYMFDTFVHIGGSGSTLALIIAIFIASRDTGTRRLSGIAFWPSLFNINEIILFGLPIVFNPIYLTPFILVPFVLLSISSCAILTGLVPQPVFSVSWTTPPIINAYIATGGSWKGVLLQVFNLGLGVALYLPFVLVADKRKFSMRLQAFQELSARSFNEKRKSQAGNHCIDLPGAAGVLARSLGNQLRTALEGDGEAITLYYQPRINLVQKSVQTVEGLLRWQHPVFGLISPNLTLALAEDMKLSGVLDRRILHVGIQQLAVWRSRGIQLDLALNASELQLQDESFLDEVSASLERYDLPSNALILEINEDLALDPSAKYFTALENFHSKGIRISVDDFGKSLQSLSYLKQLPLTDIQIHEGLIDNIVYSKSCQNILATIQDLCSEMQITITAERIESQEQLETLLELNFNTFQGFWFQEPVNADECELFVRNYGSR